jgi:hypothetical protein
MLFRQKLELPTIKVNSLDVVITEKWYAEQLCFYVGERKI